MKDAATSAPEAAILCGGQGSRLRAALPELPKALAPIGGRPFLELLVERLGAAGVPRVVLCAGYGSDAIARHFAGRDLGLPVLVSAEAEPLGTGGALRPALPLLHSDPVLVLNGDSWVPGLDLTALFRWQRQRAAAAMMVAVPAHGRDDTGALQLASSGRVLAMAEKSRPTGAGFDNAGIYLLRRALLERIPAGRAVSLERELLPDWIAAGLDAYVFAGAIVDIGTPDRLRQAQAAGLAGL